MDISWNKKTLETMNLLVAQKKIIDEIRNREHEPSLEVPEVVLVQCNLVENQYQQKSEEEYTFTPIC